MPMALVFCHSFVALTFCLSSYKSNTSISHCQCFTDILPIIHFRASLLRSAECAGHPLRSLIVIFLFPVCQRTLSREQRQIKLAWICGLPRCSRCSVKNAILFQAVVWPACNIFRSMFCIRKNDILYYLLSDNTLKVACFVFLSSSLWHSHRSLPISALHYGHLPQLLSHMFHIRSLFCHTTSSINPPTDLLLILSCLVHTIKFLRLLLN